MIRVVCEHCQTVYNIPESKLTKAVSQATCKVCQNKIVIRRDEPLPELSNTGGLSAVLMNHRNEIVRRPSGSKATETRESPPQFVRGAEQGVSETELSSSWQEAIVDNRGTNELLQRVVAPVLHGALPSAPAQKPEGATTTRTAMPMEVPGDVEVTTTANAEFEPISSGAPVGSLSAPAPLGGPRPSAPAPPPAISPAFPPASSSASATASTATTPKMAPKSAGQPVSSPPAPSSLGTAISGFAALAAAASMSHSGAWAHGYSGLTAFLAATFAAGAALASAARPRRGRAALFVALAGGAAISAAATVLLFATHRPEAQELAAARPALAPLINLLR